MVSPINSFQLLESVTKENLFDKLIAQLNKDFQLANIECNFAATILPQELIGKLNETVRNLMVNNYDDYLNLLYRIDVSEKELSRVETKDLDATIEQISFLILKREFQKVWFKSRT